MDHLQIEWQYLDRSDESETRNTCVRCSETGESLDSVIKDIATECRPAGWHITFEETKLTTDALSQSNMILLNGVPIEDVLPNAKASTSYCRSCCDMIGDPGASCRTVEVGGEAYEAIPTSLIRQAVCHVAECCG